MSIALIVRRYLRGALDDRPDVLMIDGIWFSVQRPTGERYTDSAGRSRLVTGRGKRVAIVALGLWSQDDRMQILDFHIADEQSEDACVELLNRRHLRGLTEEYVELIVSDGAGGICVAIETAYPTVARQRCIFHKLRNAADALCEKQHQAYLLDEAGWIYKADTKAGARERLEQFADEWEAANRRRWRHCSGTSTPPWPASAASISPSPSAIGPPTRERAV